MCKVMVVQGITSNTREQALRFVRAAAPAMSVNDNHGFGYAAVDTEGSLFGERWLRNREAFKTQAVESLQVQRLKNMLREAVSAETMYDSYGRVDLDHVSGITLHARMATNAVSIENTHPFFVGDMSLIHNGVISNQAQLTNITSTNDSECILNEYLAADVAGIPSRIQDVADKLRGYYACAVFARDKDGNRVLDVFKDTRASLVLCYVKQLKTWVFCTNADIVRAAAKKCKFTVTDVVAVNAGHMMRFRPDTGALISAHKFVPDRIGAAQPYTAYGMAPVTGISDDTGHEAWDYNEGGYSRRNWSAKRANKLKAGLE